MTRLLFVAGGTGGHLFPAIALAEACQYAGMSVVLLTDERGMRFCPEKDHPFEHVFVLPSVGKKRGRLYTVMAMMRFFLSSLYALRKARPVSVVGFGGMMTVPCLVWARLLGKKCMIHQSDSVMGKANRFLSRVVQHVALGYEKTLYSREITPFFVGIPIRKGFEQIPAFTDLPAQKQILILGGSQGSAFWSDIMPQAMALLTLSERQKICIHHQAPATHPPVYPEGVQVRVVPFIQDMKKALEKAHIVFSRAGASSVAELCASARPAFFVPYPFAKDNHQKHNAEYIVSKGGGWMCEQSACSPVLLADFLRKCLYDEKDLVSASHCIRSLCVQKASEKMAAAMQILLEGKKKHV